MEKNTRTLRSFEKNGCPCPILECAQKLNKHMWVRTKKSTRKCESAEKSTSKCEFTAFRRIIDMQVWVRAEKSTGKCECTKKHLNYKQVWVCTENLLESLSMLRNIHKQASAEQTSLKSIFIFIQYSTKEAILIYVNVNLTQYGTVKNDVLFIIHYWKDCMRGSLTIYEHDTAKYTV